MADRARLSKLKSYTSSNGSSFLGSPDFPLALIASLSKSDPKALLFGTSDVPSRPSEPEQILLRKILNTKIKNKKILVCSGGTDKLVPYHCSKPFLQFLKNAIEPGEGWYRDGGVYLEDNVYEGVGHQYSDGMVKDTVRFISNILAGREGRSETKL